MFCNAVMRLYRKGAGVAKGIFKTIITETETRPSVWFLFCVN